MWITVIKKKGNVSSFLTFKLTLTMFGWLINALAESLSLYSLGQYDWYSFGKLLADNSNFRSWDLAV